jgi:hypothetical protein
MPSHLQKVYNHLLEPVLVVDALYSPGRTNRNHIARAQSRPDGVTLVPSALTRCPDVTVSFTSTPPVEVHREVTVGFTGIVLLRLGYTLARGTAVVP